MSEQKMASIGTGTGRSGPSVQAFHPLWMAHWMRPNRNAAGKIREHGNEELDCASRSNKMTDGPKDLRPVKEPRVIESKTSEIVGSKGEENKTECWSLMERGQITDNKQALRVFGHNIKRDKAIDCKGETQFPLGIAAVQASSERCNSAGEGTSNSLPEWMKTHSSAIDRSIAVLKPFHGPTMESSTHIAPYCDLKKCEIDKAQKEFHKEQAPLIIKPPIVSKDQLPNYNTRMLEQENCCKHHSDTTMDVCFRDINASLLFDTPSTSHHRLPTLGQGWLQKMQNHSSCEMFPSQGVISEKTESKKPCCNSYSLQKLPYCVHDTKTMRICATVDSMEATPEGFPRFSQTTHNVLITKDVNVSKENDVFGTTDLVAEMNGNTHRLSPFSGQGKRGIEFQSLSGSSSSKGKRNFEDLVASKFMIKNESSAETDIMDIDLFKEGNSSPGASYASSIKKGFNVESGLSPHVDATSSGEVTTNHRTEVMPPDINLEIPALPAAASSYENACPTSSSTQSLDMDMDVLPAHSELHNKRSNPSSGDPFEADPTMRWVKRLKMRSSNSSSQATMSLNLVQNPSPVEMEKCFKKILESGIASSKPTPRSHPAKTQGLSKANEDFMATSAKIGDELLLSQAWIKRWLRNGSKVTEKKPVTVVCEPQSYKLALDDFQKKRLPSIAAMALMGKAVNGLQSCELQKQDSFTIWNTGVLKQL